MNDTVYDLGVEIFNLPDRLGKLQVRDVRLWRRGRGELKCVTLAIVGDDAEMQEVYDALKKHFSDDEHDGRRPPGE